MAGRDFIGGVAWWLAFHGGTDAEGDGRDVMAVARGDVAAIQGFSESRSRCSRARVGGVSCGGQVRPVDFGVRAKARSGRERARAGRGWQEVQRGQREQALFSESRGAETGRLGALSRIGGEGVRGVG